VNSLSLHQARLQVPSSWYVAHSQCLPSSFRLVLQRAGVHVFQRRVGYVGSPLHVPAGLYFPCRTPRSADKKAFTLFCLRRPFVPGTMAEIYTSDLG
jgi:hypothetical protein